MRRTAAIAWASAIVLSGVFGASAEPMPAPPMLPTPEPHIRFAGGDGSSCSRAVVIEGANHEREGVRAQRWWVFTNHPGGRIAEQKLSHDSGRDFETFDVLAPDGSHRAVCFDITSFFGKP